jgi:dTDP-4-amino-4,6-dideoxygalactose transaminase
MAVPPLDLAAHHRPQVAQFLASFEQIIRTGQFVGGPMVERFETHLAQVCGCSHGIGMSSGTDALLAALMALEIGPGDEVIVPPFTFFATAGSIVRVGARPVFVDIDPVSFNIDPACAAAAVTPRTRAIMPVHLFGQMADMDAILALADRHGLVVIEDAAQAIAATDAGRPAGSLGRVGCLSFYPTKNLSAMGDAGACVTGDDALAERLRQLRNHGQSGLYEHALVGGNFRLDAIQAAILDLKLPHLENWTQRRRVLAQRYDRLLTDADLPLTLPVELSDKRHVYHQYTVRVTDGRREALREHLRAAGIGHGVFYPRPLHLQPCFADIGGREGDCPHAERAAREVLSLPMHPELTDAQQDEVVGVLRKFWK